MDKTARLDMLAIVMAILLIVLMAWLIKMRLTGGA